MSNYGNINTTVASKQLCLHKNVSMKRDSCYLNNFRCTKYPRPHSRLAPIKCKINSCKWNNKIFLLDVNHANRPTKLVRSLVRFPSLQTFWLSLKAGPVPFLILFFIDEQTIFLVLFDFLEAPSSKCHYSSFVLHYLFGVFETYIYMALVKFCAVLTCKINKLLFT